MNNLFEAVDSQNFFTLNEAKVTDYIDADRLGEICTTNPILKTFNDCEPIEGMILKMTGDMGISYYKVIKNDDGEFEAYLISESGEKLGDPFLLETQKIEETTNKEELTDLFNKAIGSDNLDYIKEQLDKIYALMKKDILGESCNESKQLDEEAEDNFEMGIMNKVKESLTGIEGVENLSGIDYAPYAANGEYFITFNNNDEEYYVALGRHEE